MHSTLLAVASLALLAFCVCAPAEDLSIQNIPPKAAETPSVTGKDGVKSGVADTESSEPKPIHIARERRSIGGLESDLLPSGGDIDASPFGETSQLEGRGRIRVLPAFLG